MPYYNEEQISVIREIDLLTYLRKAAGMLPSTWACILLLISMSLTL